MAAGIGVVSARRDGRGHRESAKFIGLGPTTAEYVRPHRGALDGACSGVTVSRGIHRLSRRRGTLTQRSSGQGGQLTSACEVRSRVVRAFSTSPLIEVRRAENADADKLANQGIDDAIRRVLCPRCGAEPGEGCVGPLGREARLFRPRTCRRRRPRVPTRTANSQYPLLTARLDGLSQFLEIDF